MGICPNNQLDFNYGGMGDRAGRIRDLIFRNGLDASLVRSNPCTGHTKEISEELQTFARENYGLNTDLITKAINTIILDGETDLLGNTTYWDEPNTYIETASVSMTGVDVITTYEYVDIFNGININLSANNGNIVDSSFQLLSAQTTAVSATTSTATVVGDYELSVSSTVGFYEGAYIVINKDAIDPLDIELFQVKYVSGSSLILRTPELENNIFPSTGLSRAHIAGTSINLVDISLKDVDTDYTLNLSTGAIVLSASSFSVGDLIFFNYQYDQFTIYTEVTDFDVDYEEGIITRLTTGIIPLGQSVMIDYEYNHPCLDPKTGAPRRNCENCNGFGFVSSPSEQIRGLFHIPNYDSPLTQAGFWQMGDAFFTVPESSDFNDITAEPKGDEGFFVRDMIVIDDKYWLVMTKPQSFNLQNEFLGRKLHLRMISE